MYILQGEGIKLTSVKDSSIAIVRKGFMKAVESRGLDIEEAEIVFESALEEMRSDLHLVTLSLQSPLTELQAERYSRTHASNLERFLESTGFSRTTVRMLTRHLQAEMSDQLHAIHESREDHALRLLVS